MPKPFILNSIERKFILLVVDLIIVLASLNVFINNAIDEKFFSVKLKSIVFIVGIILYILLSYVLDFYNLEKIRNRRYVLSQSLYISFLYVFSTFMFTLITFDVSFWRWSLITYLCLTPIQIGLWRLFFSNVFKIIPIIKNVLYVYEDSTSRNIEKEISAINGIDKETFYKVKLTYSLDQNSNINREYFMNAVEKIDTFILNTRSYDNIPPELEKLLLKSILKRKEVFSFTSFYENIYEALPIKSRNDSFYEILQLKNKKIRYLQVIFNFLINFSLSLFVGFFLIGIIPFVFFLNLFFNKGPLFYSQKRIGQFGNEFNIYKFRSMVVDAEKLGAKMATKGDSRITPFGKILRLFRIDELPQIISVINGDMQFIGPRPERKVFVKELIKITPFYNIRHLIKPGITGWAQVKFKYGETLQDSIQKLEYDLYYIKNKSITLDLRIVFKTITTVLFSRGV